MFPFCEQEALATCDSARKLDSGVKRPCRREERAVEAGGPVLSTSVALFFVPLFMTSPSGLSSERARLRIAYLHSLDRSIILRCDTLRASVSDNNRRTRL